MNSREREQEKERNREGESERERKKKRQPHLSSVESRIYENGMNPDLYARASAILKTFSWNIL